MDVGGRDRFGFVECWLGRVVLCAREGCALMIIDARVLMKF